MELGLSAVSTPATLQSARVRGYERSSKDSATISPENPSQAIRTLLAIIVEHGGGDFVGIQDALAEYGLPAYVLFNHPKHRSTLAAAMSTSAQKRLSCASPSATKNSAGIVYQGEESVPQLKIRRQAGPSGFCPFCGSVGARDE